MSTETLTDPRVVVETYVIRPTAYSDDLPAHDRNRWSLQVTNGHEWGWSVREYGWNQAAMNRKGEFIYESRGSKANRFRRYPLDEALALALKYVDTHTFSGFTLAEWRARIEAKP